MSTPLTQQQRAELSRMATEDSFLAEVEKAIIRLTARVAELEDLLLKSRKQAAQYSTANAELASRCQHAEDERDAARQEVKRMTGALAMQRPSASEASPTQPIPPARPPDFHAPQSSQLQRAVLEVSESVMRLAHVVNSQLLREGSTP